MPALIMINLTLQSVVCAIADVITHCINELE
jgi:hypothetical protein